MSIHPRRSFNRGPQPFFVWRPYGAVMKKSEIKMIAAIPIIASIRMSNACFPIMSILPNNGSSSQILILT